MPRNEQLRRFLSAFRKNLLRALGGFALLAAFVLSGFAALRLAIHGREVTVPDLANLSDADAEAAVSKLGLHLSVENRFYAATVAPNHVLSQSPGAGSSVRRGWQIRVTESLGSQQVAVPDVTGQDQHPAELMLKRLQLELGTVAHVPGPGPAGTILAQSPPPDSAGLDGPRVAVLVSDGESAPSAEAYVMPAIVGLTVGTANARLGAAGLHVSVQSPSPDPSTSADGANASTAGESDPAIPPTVVPAAPEVTSGSVITSQSPQPGHRVTRADSIHVTVSGGS